MEEKDKRHITPLPKSIPITATVLLILGIISTQFIDQIFSAEQLARNAILSGIPFILIFASVILYFMAFIWFLSNKLNFRVSDRTYKIIEKVTIGGIVLGILMMFQPWIFPAFRYGFYLLLLATLAFITWSHITPAPAEDEFATELPATDRKNL